MINFFKKFIVVAFFAFIILFIVLILFQLFG